MFIQGPTFIILAQFSKPDIYSWPYIFNFFQNVHALHLFPALRLFQSLEYISNWQLIKLAHIEVDSVYTIDLWNAKINFSSKGQSVKFLTS